MNITKVVIRNFKRFQEETFNLDGNVVIAGPNNSGKTTLLQAIATWSLALTRWRELNDYQRHSGAYTRAPLARQAFYSVPLRAFDLLWHQRKWRRNQIEIEVTGSAGHIPIEIESDSSEQVYVRPSKNVEPDLLRSIGELPKPIFVPAMTGLSTEEPVYQQPKIDQLLGQGKPGDVLRNLLVKASNDQDAWNKLTDSIKKMFGYELLSPNTDGPNIVAEYQHPQNKTRFDIASAGSGFLQVLMLLTFLNIRKGTVLLLDEPDAHLYMILQDSIYSELRNTAQNSKSQLIIATHSEVVINAVDPRELCALLDHPIKLADDNEKSMLIRSLSALSNMDTVTAVDKKQILYVEGHTDLSILKEWANILDHRVKDFLRQPFWKPTVSETRQGTKGIKAKDHFESLRLATSDIKGVEIVDSDGKDRPLRRTATDGMLLKLCWRRYEIESYLIHPVALARFVSRVVGEEAPLASIDAMQQAMKRHLPDKVVENPLDKHALLKDTGAKTNILQLILDEAGLQGFHYSRYYEIAVAMQPEEIHPEVTEKLDQIAEHFNL